MVDPFPDGHLSKVELSLMYFQKFLPNTIHKMYRKMAFYSSTFGSLTKCTYKLTQEKDLMLGHGFEYEIQLGV